jgi:predicted transcriptional regulator
MTPTQFRRCLAALGLTRRRAAALLGISLASVQRYAQGQQPIPLVVRRFLLAWELLPPSARRRVEEAQ